MESADALVGLLAGAVLLLAPWPLWRLLAVAAFRRGRRAPALSIALAGGLLLVLVGTALLWEPLLLLPPAGIAVAAVAFAWLRSLPGYGRTRGLPPGRLGFLPVEPLRDDRFLLRQAARYGPLFKMGTAPPYLSLRPMVCCLDPVLGQEVLRRHDGALAVVPVMPFNRYVPRGFLRYMAPEDHRHYGRLLHRAFAGFAEAELDRGAAAAAGRCLARMEEASRDGRGVKPRPYLHGLAFAELARVLFGIEQGGAAFARLRDDCGFLAFSRARRLWRGGARRRRAEELLTFLSGAAPQGGWSGPSPESLLGRLIEDAPEARRDRTLLGNLLVMQVSGSADLAGLLTWLVKLLADNPSWLERLAGDAVPAARGSLADRVVQETLRMEQSEYVFRRTTSPIQVGDYRVPSGWVLRICVREAHRDPVVFPAPDRFDPERFAEGGPGLPSYAPFGLFRHKCLGAGLTHAVARNLAQVLARDFTLAVTEDGPREHPLFHWEPSHRFRVAIGARATAQAERDLSEAMKPRTSPAGSL